MKKRAAILLGAAVVAAMAGAGAVWGVAAWRQRSRPNVILIVVDSLRPDRLSAYGYGRPTSQNIDRVASRGVVFTGANSTSCWTLPAVASLFTGLYPETHGVRYALSYGSRIISQQELPSEYEVLAERFKGAGYRTYGVSSNLHIRKELGFGQGFDRFLYVNLEDSDVVEEETMKLAGEIKAAPGPFFLYLHFLDTHFPYLARRPWIGRLDPDFETYAQEVMKLKVERFTEDHVHRQDPRLLMRLGTLYDSEVMAVDDSVGRILATLDDPGRTVVVLTADHGEAFDEHQQMTHGTGLGVEQLGVPLIFRLPGERLAGTRVTEPVSLIDVPVTLLSLAGIEPPRGTEGIDLGPLMAGIPAEPRLLFADVLREVKQKAAFNREWKVVWHLKTNRIDYYRVGEDPRESRPLGKEESGTARALKERHLERRLELAPRVSPREIPLRDEREELREKLRSIGYL